MGAMVFLGGCGAVKEQNVLGTLNSTLDQGKVKVSVNNNANPCSEYLTQADLVKEFGGTWKSGGTASLKPANNKNFISNCSITYLTNGSGDGIFGTVSVGVTTLSNNQTALEALNDMQAVQESKTWAGPVIGNKTVLMESLGSTGNDLVFVSGSRLVSVSYMSINQNGSLQKSDETTHLIVLAGLINGRLK